MNQEPRGIFVAKELVLITLVYKENTLKMKAELGY